MADGELAGAAHIRIDLDDAGLEADVQRAAQRAGQDFERALVRSAQRAARTMRRTLERAARDLTVHVRVEPDLSRMAGLGSITVPVEPDATLFMARLRAALAGEQVSVPVVPDLSGFDARLRAHRAPAIRVPVEADEAGTDRLTTSLARLGAGLGITARVSALTLALGLLGGAAAASAASLVGIGAALAPTVGILAAYPAAILGASAALGALRLATLGVSEAFEAALTGDAAEFQKSLESLSPAARAAALEVRALRPEFDQLRNAVQDAFFERIEGDITRVAAALGGPLRSGLQGIAADWGAAAAAAAGYLASAEGVTRVSQVLAGTQQVTGALSGEVRGLVAGFLNLAGAISEAFGARTASALGGLAAQFGDFLTEIAESGQAVDWVSGAVETFSQLGTVVGNLGSIITSVFQAAADAGGDVLGIFGQVTGEAAKFLNSAEGSAALVGVFETLAAVGAALGPVLTELVTQVGALAPAFVPVIEALGPALQGVLAALGPALQGAVVGLQAIAGGLAGGLGILGPALQPLGVALGAALTALAPLLPLLGQLASLAAGVLTGALQILTTALSPVIEALSTHLAPLFPQLIAVVQQLTVATLPLASALGESLAVALQQLLPPLVALVPQLLEGLMPAFQQLVAAIVPLLPLLVELAVTALQPVIAILPQLITLFVTLVNAVTPLLNLLQLILPPAVRLYTTLMSWVNVQIAIPILSLIVGALNGLARALSAVIGAVVSFVTMVIGWFQRLYDVLVGNSIIPDLVNGIIRWFGMLPGRLVGIAVQVVTQVIATLAALPGRAAALAAQVVERVADTFAKLPGRAASALSGLASRLAGAIGDASGRAVSAAAGLVSDIVGAFSGLAGKIADSIGDVGGAIMGKIAGQVPSGIRDLLPDIGLFANGGIVDRPTLGVIGEAGREVVVPLTRPARARQLADQSGLTDILAAGGGGDGRGGGGPRTVHNHTHTWTLQEVGDAEVTARRVMHRMAMAAGV